MEKKRKITREEYKARWAYSELDSDSRFSDDYPKGLETKKVREKARLKIKFDDLEADDRIVLVHMLNNSERARPAGGLLPHLDDVECLQLEHWTKAQIRATRLVQGLGWSRMGDFYDSMAVPGATFGINDPRHKVASLDPKTEYAAPVEAICVVPFTTNHGQFELLLEGTGRALTFLKLAKDEDTIPVWTKSEC